MSTARRPRHSVFRRLALIYASAFALSATLLIGLLYTSIEHFLTAQSRDLVETEARRLAQPQGLIEVRDMVGQAIESHVVDPRSAEPGPGFLYFLAGPDGRCDRGGGPAGATAPLAGDAGCPMASLPHWQSLPVPAAAVSETYLDIPGLGTVPVVATVERLRSGYQVMVAKPIDGEQAFLAQIGRLASLAILGAVLIGLAVAWLVSRYFVAQINQINAACARVGRDGLKARLPAERRDDEFALLVDNINAMLDRIGELVQVLSSVTEQVAHDFRTPLTRLRDRLRRRGEHDADAARSVADIDLILASFDGILRVARAEAAGTTSFEPIDLASLLQDVVELYGPVAEDRGHVLETDIEPLTVTGEAALVRQLVVNLLDNAIKYTPPPGRLRLNLHRSGDWAVLQVVDDGPGIPASRRERSTETFVRLEAPVATRGSGFGLGFVRAVARSHGFVVALEEGHPGLVVVVRMPLTFGT